MNRGSPDLRAGPALTRASFNEAPIHESGKSGRRRRGDPRHPRFNEAPIHESGKSRRR